MNRIEKRINEVRDRGERYLISLLPLGDPDLNASLELTDLYLQAGSDLIEIAMPSRDPRCDSRQIAEAGARAFENQTDLRPYFDTIRQIRKNHPDEPLEVMFYSDVLLGYGIEGFVEQLAKADVDALLLADSVLLGEDVLGPLDEFLQPTGIPRIRFMPHPFNENLLDDFALNARLFVILQSITDEAGNRPVVDPGNRALVERLKALDMKAAITLAYSINSPERVRESVATGADGIIVGTVLVDLIHDGDYAVLKDFIHSLKQNLIVGKDKI